MFAPYSLSNVRMKSCMKLILADVNHKRRYCQCLYEVIINYCDYAIIGQKSRVFASHVVPREISHVSCLSLVNFVKVASGSKRIKFTIILICKLIAVFSERKTAL